MRSSRRMLLVFAFGMAPSLAAQDLTEMRRSQCVELAGVVLLNAYYNDDLVNDRDGPWLAFPRHPFAGERLEALGGTIRQSRITLSAWASDVLGGYVEGELDLDFFGDREGRRREPVPRIRRAVGSVRWSHAWLIFGQEALPISPYDPSSLSMVGVPGFTGSGNLSRWMPQVRLGVDVGSAVRVGIEATAVAPRFDRLLSDPEPEPDRAERSRRPFVQGRLLTRWGNDSTGGEISVGGHYGWFTSGVDTLGVTRAGAVTARFFLSQFVEVRGEAFVGEGLGMLGGGGVDQTLSPRGNPVRTRGGWAQLNLHPARSLKIGGGYGVDDPENADLDSATGRRLNVSWELHCQLHVTPLLFAVEYRRLETTYADAIYNLQTANHVNVALGFEF